LSHYSNNIESAGLRKCPYYHYVTMKVAEFAPQNGLKTASTDMK